MVSHLGFEPWVGTPQLVAFTTPTVSPLTSATSVARMQLSKAPLDGPNWE
jgi:hypothetical protein